MSLPSSMRVFTPSVIPFSAMYSLISSEEIPERLRSHFWPWSLVTVTMIPLWDKKSWYFTFLTILLFEAVLDGFPDRFLVQRPLSALLDDGFQRAGLEFDG